MTNRLPVIGVIVAVILFLIWSSIFVVNEREQAIVLRFGEIVDVKTEPGIYFKAPFGFFEADNVQIIEDRVMRFDLDDIRVQVSGGKFYEVDAFVAYRVSDPRKFREAVSGQVELAELRLRTRLDAALRRVYGLRGFEAALSEERADMMREVRDQLRPDAASLGLEIEDVRIQRTDLTAEVSQQTYDRMKAERLAEAERLRARGREAAQRIRARADREVVEIVADARREFGDLARRGRGRAQPHLRRCLPARPAVLRFLSVDVRLPAGVGEFGHHHGAVAGLGVLPLLPRPGRRAFAGRSDRGAASPWGLCAGRRHRSRDRRLGRGGRGARAIGARGSDLGAAGDSTAAPCKRLEEASPGRAGDPLGGAAVTDDLSSAPG